MIVTGTTPRSTTTGTDEHFCGKQRADILYRHRPRQGPYILCRMIHDGSSQIG